MSEWGAGMSDRSGSQTSSRWPWVFAGFVALALHLGCVAFAVANLQANDSDVALGAQGLEIGLQLAAPRASESEFPPGPDNDASAASPDVDEQKAKQSDLPKDTPRETEDPDRIVSADASKNPKDDEPDKPAVKAAPSNEAVAAQATATPSLETAVQSERSVTPAQGSGDSKRRVRASWQRELVAYFDRHKRYPKDRDTQKAEIVVGFVLDRKGHILSVNIVKSSGDAAFDEAALSMMKRSDPVPPPPPLIADESLNFTLPVQFRPQGRS